jgi:hypothetical protein
VRAANMRKVERDWISSLNFKGVLSVPGANSGEGMIYSQVFDERIPGQRRLSRALACLGTAQSGSGMERIPLSEGLVG